jgi:hypothetical protein
VHPAVSRGLHRDGGFGRAARTPIFPANAMSCAPRASRAKPQSATSRSPRWNDPAKREEIYKRLARAIPEPKSELEHTTPYELLVAVVLSAQATDKSVNLATQKLYPVANTPEKIAALGVEGSSNTSAPSACTAARRRT